MKLVPPPKKGKTTETSGSKASPTKAKKGKGKATNKPSDHTTTLDTNVTPKKRNQKILKFKKLHKQLHIQI